MRAGGYQFIDVQQKQKSADVVHEEPLEACLQAAGPVVTLVNGKLRRVILPGRVQNGRDMTFAP